MKKRITAIVLAMVLMVSLLPGLGVSAEQEVKVVLFSQMLTFDVPPQLINGRTMVPLRVIFEALGATVNWDDPTQTVTSTRENTTVSLTIGVPSITVNGSVIALDTAPCVIDGRTLVPARAVSEAFGLSVAWDDASWTVYITEPETPFTKLKNYVLQNGELIDGMYHVFWAPGSEEASQIAMLISYDPEENTLFCMLNAVTGRGEEASASNVMVAIYEDDQNGVVFDHEQPDTNYQIVGIYTTPDAPCTELVNTFPTDEQKVDGRKKLDEVLVLMDTMLQAAAGQSLRAFGIYYAK